MDFGREALKVKTLKIYGISTVHISITSQTLGDLIYELRSCKYSEIISSLVMYPDNV